MGQQTRRAAQYIRMSTDRQDLSPLIQSDAIRAFAAAKGFEIVSSYEDEGKSGVELLNRPRLRQLLKDVANAPPFSDILVYDVSRWGRFQDADAAAYYEYHCRLHGVQVIYVSESFANDHAPATVLLKSMRRVMAAEYSRDIAFKSRAGQQRVVDMGFQMGPLPSLGYRRCSVSANGSRRVLLQHGQRKAALTDRIEWVLGPEAEVDLVRRMGKAYACGFALEEITGLVKAENWRTDKGRSLSPQGLKRLLSNEALIGNFVWGVKSKGGKVIQCSPTRMNDCVPRILGDATWARIQERLATASRAHASRTSLRDARERSRDGRAPVQLKLPLGTAGPDPTYRRTLGASRQLRDHTREFGKALHTRLGASGLHAAFDTRTNVLTFWDARIRVRLMWPSAPGTWTLERSRSACDVASVLVARMTALYRPLDFFLLPSHCLQSAFARALDADVPRELRRYWCRSSQEVVARLSALCARNERTARQPAKA